MFPSNNIFSKEKYEEERYQGMNSYTKTWKDYQKKEEVELSTSDSLGLGLALVILLVAAILG